ncbi:hypothetical protein FHS55_001584 [Angulomicrobium tetraedrale]|uniref:Uncharacterized protein n=1 Tax=Ancylobacter tetraedralis TaxID=217068 RepID=A0A839Z5P1_9HYPH|nr:hypothetical protein [Ancylobacter tetraedralis]MBB3770989.1 hypothetical protein [Ancylobacter tetraedralis]
MPNTSVPADATPLPANPLNRRDMLAVLVMVQNSAGNGGRDIMTIAGMCDDGELADHVFSEWRRIRSTDRKVAVLRYARSLVS